MAGQKTGRHAGDFHPEVLRLFDKYVHGVVDRRGFLDGAAKFVVGDLLATRVPDLQAGAAFYGAPPPLDKVPAIHATLLLLFAGEDERINGMWPPYEAALKAARVPYEAIKYPGTQHGFNNDTTPRYDDSAARQAWARTLGLFDRTLRV